MPPKAKPLVASTPHPRLTELPPLRMDSGGIAEDFRRHFTHTLGRDKHCRSGYYSYEGLVLTLRDRLMERWKKTRYAWEETDCRQAFYISMEYLMGRALGNTLLSLDTTEATRAALDSLGLELDEVADYEHDAGLGNGGLGRLAACFLDSCATLQLPVVGYGIRYQYGMFRQHIDHEGQVEEPDHWLRDGFPWELERPEHTKRVRFGGRVEYFNTSDGRRHAYMRGTSDVLAVPYDVPIPGYANDTVNTLRLWSAAATDEFSLADFNQGDYTEAVRAKNTAEHISMVLYPNDASENGKELRLRQQYFLASASLQDVVDHWVENKGEDFTRFADKRTFQLNDTHPSCAVPELMRILMDDHGLEWEAAWDITSRTMAYTNHTLLPEALERWPLRLFEQLLPRVLEIIYEINRRFLDEVERRWPGDMERRGRMSIVEEGDEQMVRMAFLAIVGSYSVNGVAALHSRLLKDELFRDFYELWPHKFNNKTNGVTPRRWLAACNPTLRGLLDETIGPEWVADLGRLEGLRRHADDPAFRERWREVKRINKGRLAALVQADCGVTFGVDAMYDVQVKRIHEYKRQLLNVLHVIHLYDRIQRGDTDDWTPRCVLIGGKAAPGYFMAKRIIKLVVNVANEINADPRTEGLLRLVFLPNYRVTAMETICPGSDLSEQISTAGKEASGTGNMKLMMNGAVTIGTLDGANIEIRDAVGEENFFLFGLTTEQVQATRGHYDPQGIIAGDEDLRRVIEMLRNGRFNRYEPGIFDPIVDAVTSPHDPWLTAADFRAYVDAQRAAAAAYRDQERWTRMSILNAAAAGIFSTDRTIGEYNQDIWRLDPIQPLPIA